MFWFRNHGITGESDSLRIPLRNANVPVVAYQDDGETTPVVVLRGWTGVKIDSALSVQALENAFLDGLGDQTQFAYKQNSDHPDYDNKSTELDAYYEGNHPEQS